MCAQSCAQHAKFKEGFSRGEKVFMRLGFYGYAAVGVYGIWLDSPAWALVYLALFVAGMGVVVLSTLCAHCSYAHHSNDCLFLPPWILQRFFPYRGPTLSTLDKAAFLVSTTVSGLFPLFWLVGHPLVLVVYLALLVPTSWYVVRRVCPVCKNVSCPLNKAHA